MACAIKTVCPCPYIWKNQIQKSKNGSKETHCFSGFCYLIIACCVFLTSGNTSIKQENVTPESVHISGKRIWNSNQCSTCHSIFGLGGHLGPDLTNLNSRQDKSYIHNIIRTGLKKMPAYDLTDAEIQSLHAYFQYLNELGSYPGKSVKEDYFG